MGSAHDEERTLQMLLAGTPLRVLDATQVSSPEARADLDATREALGLLGLALDPVPVRETSRDRLAAALDALERPPRRPALVVMDMLRDHLTPGAPLEVPRARAVVPAMRRALEDARRDGVPVVYLCDHHDPGDPELDAWGTHNTGDPAEEVWPEVAPAPGDVVIPHRTYSGFFETRFDDVLRARGVNTLVLTGCLTEVQLYVTAVDALQRGYRVEVPEALQAGSSPLAEQVTLKTLSALVPVAARQ